MNARPNPLPKFYRLQTNILQAPLLLAVTAVCATTALLISVIDRKGRAQHAIARFWAHSAVLISMSKLKVEGAENFRKQRVAVYASNHTSFMDTPAIFAALPFQFRILAKKDLWRWPLIGWYLRRSGQMPIDIENPHATLSSLGGAVKALRAGMPLFVFPEGGRTPDGELRPFLSGAAYLAIRAQVPLVPIALSGAYDLLPMHTRHFYPGKVTLKVGEPIETSGMTVRQISEATEQLRNAIGEMLGQAARAGAEVSVPVA